MAENFQVHGLTELNKKLSELPAKIEKNILRSMVRAGANVVKQSAVEKLEGGQKSDIIIKPSRRKSRGKIVFEVGPTKEKWYLKFKESGALPHVIETSTARILSDGSEVYGVEVSHPGLDKRPFLRPALDENVDKIVEAMAKQGAKRVEKLAK